jgi:sialic acid synthase SpsE
MGAKVIERHFTLDRTMKGSDHSASLEKAGLELVIRDCKNIHAALGTSVKEMRPAEIPGFHKLAKSVVAAIAIPAGKGSIVDTHTAAYTPH